MQRKQILYLLAIVALLVSMLPPLATAALAQEPTTAAVTTDAAAAKAACTAFSAAEQQEFDALTAMKAAETLTGANLARYDALAQQQNCHSARVAATEAVQPDQPKGAVRLAPTVTKTVGAGGDYATLKAAFDDINSGTLTGSVQLDVIGDTTETATAVLNASGSGSASYSAVLIQPSGGAARTISGAIAAGSPLIDLNGADNVTIDGLNSGGNSLTIANTTVSNTSGTSTIRFQADATSNTITNASILGSSTMATTTNGGNIWFGAAAITTGNDNNVISNCNIGPVGSNLPTKAIYGNGTTTTAAQYNSGNQITGNNIYDYFNAAAQANAIYLGAGNTAWTISNNRIYQTATRTQTTGAILAGIQAASSTGNEGHTISGNVIGFANSAGTGTTNLVGIGAGSKFLGIYFSSAGTPTASSIQGNTIAGINLSGIVGGTSTSAAFVGISIASGVANIGNVTGNTIGSLTTADSVSITSNNASSMEVYGIYYFPSATANVSNNNVGGITATNSGAGSLILYGLRAFTSSTVVNTFANNTVGSAAAPISVSSSATGSRLLGLYSQSGVSVVTGNTVSNLTMNSPNVGTGSTASLIGLWSDNSSATIGNNVAQNTIYALSNSNASAAVWVTGLQYNGATTGAHLVQRNFIYNLSTPSTSATATVNGIQVQGGLTTYQNNMIALGSDMTANSPQINGIAETVAGTDSFYHNSVYIGGAAVAAGTANSFAFQSTITINTRAYRNNIFFNARSNGAATGKHYAIQVGGTTPNPSGLTSNNNILYAPGTGGFVGRFNLLDQATLANWQAATGQDVNSFSVDPQFLAPAAPTPDLHLNPSVATVAEGNGFLIASVTDDFDGQTRATLTPVDIGADAGNFIGIDLAPPMITYTLLANTLSTSNRALNNVVITDVSGVNTAAGTKPRVYYKRSTDGNVWNDNTSSTDGWKYAEANAASSPFDFTIDYSLLNGGTGVNTGTVVQYFVVAQDLAATPNVGINSGVFAAAPSSVALTAAAFPIVGTINSYLIATAFSGTYTVPGSYPSLTNAGGIFEAMNAGVLTGNVVIEITADLTSETGAVALNQLDESVLDATFTVTIKPSGGPRTISGTSAANSGLIILNGADNVTIDGSTSGGADQSLTITNLSTTGVVIWMRSASAANGAGGNTVKNCVINGNSGTTTIAGVLSSGSVLGGDAEAANSNNTIQNNLITKVQNALYLRGGATTPTLDQNWLVTENTFGSTVAADKLGFRGMLIGNAQNFTVSKNTIDGVVSSTSSSSTMSGIQVALLVSGGLVSQNKISDIKQINTTGWGSNGIYLTATSTAAALTVANNFVSDVASYGYNGVTQGDNGYGIMVNSGGGYKIVYNSVLMATNQTATTGIPAAINIASGVTTGGVDLRNNIFANTQTVGTRYAIYSAAPNTVFSTINYNNYYPGTGTLGYLGAAQATLAAWQAATGQDANSVVGDPLFVSNTDLHITNESSPASNAGTPIAGITIDIDGQSRSSVMPDIGADEFGVVPEPAITLDKTVGTDPLVCATTDAIALPAGGGDVTYCYEVTNTGDVTLNLHDLDDSELGNIFSGLSYALTPGASVFVTETTNIAVTTVNTATWSAYNVQEPPVQATDVATVTVEMANPAISLDKTVGTDPLVCATTDEITVPADTDVTYCYTVENTGNVTLNLHDLDDSELGNLFSGLSYALTPGASVFVTATTNIAVTTVNTATWTAYNVQEPPVQATDAATVTVQAANNPAIELNKTVGTVPAVCAATNQISVPYGTSVYYCYQIENTGNVTMTVHSLVDDQLGALLTNLPYVLPPGAFSPQVIVADTAVVAVTNTATWTAASSVGYTVDTNAAFNYVPINTTGTGLALADDGEANITIPWGATFFGVTSSNLRVGNNGGILFNATTGDVGITNAALPNAAHPLALFPFWDDMDSDTGDVYWEVQGTTPNRMLIVEWYNRPHFSNVGSATFEVILYETSNEIKYQYLDVDFGDPLFNNGASATVGINKDATTALQVSFNQPVIQNGQAILFSPAAILTASDSDWAEVTVLIPNIDVDPLSMSATQATNTTSNQTLDIGNTGDAPLTWEIAETQPDRPARAGVQAAPEPVFNVPAAVSSKADCAAFENYPGREPQGWAEFCGQPADAPASSPQGPTSNGYSVDLRNDRFVRFALNNFPGQVLVGPQTGNLYGLDFDSTATTLYALNDAATDQLGTVNTATGVFTPIVDCPAPAAGTWTGLSIDPVTNVFYASTAANLYTIDPATCSPVLIGPFGVSGGIMIDIAIGSAGVMYGHDIFTDSIYTIDTSTGAATLVGSTGFAANFAQGMDFDNEDGTLYIWLYIGTGANRYGTVNLATGAVTPLATDNPLGEFEGATETLGLCVPNDYGWLSTAPITGTTAANSVTPVTVTFDSTGLPVGVYNGQLCIRSNDPDTGPGNGTSLVQVPVTLTVTVPTAVTLSGLAASGETAQAPLPLAGLPLAALPATIGLALGAAYVLRRRK